MAASKTSKGKRRDDTAAREALKMQLEKIKEQLDKLIELVKTLPEEIEIPVNVLPPLMDQAIAPGQIGKK